MAARWPRVATNENNTEGAVHRFSDMRDCRYEYIYGKYDKNVDLQSLYQIHNESNSPFRGVDRIKLIQKILETEKSVNGAGFNLKEFAVKQVGARAIFFTPTIRAPICFFFICFFAGMRTFRFAHAVADFIR